MYIVRRVGWRCNRSQHESDDHPTIACTGHVKHFRRLSTTVVTVRFTIVFCSTECIPAVRKLVVARISFSVFFFGSEGNTTKQCTMPSGKCYSNNGNNFFFFLAARSVTKCLLRVWKNDDPKRCSEKLVGRCTHLRIPWTVVNTNNSVLYI